MADVCITEFTDPGCPWAWSAEPFRRRLSWIYGDALEWRTAMVVLAEDPREYEEKGFTPERQSQSFKKISAEHGMPIDSRERPRMAATAPACRAVVAARLRDPEQERPLLRRLRVRHFSGDLLDEQTTIAGAASDIGLDPDELQTWMEADEVDEAGAGDKAGRGTVGRPRPPARAPASRSPPRRCSTRSSPTGRAGAATPARRTRSRGRA